MEGFSYEYSGFCPCCERAARFVSHSEWFRDFLACSECGSIVRERAIALVLQEVMPGWKSARIHESSPSNRGVSQKLRNGAQQYIASQYFPNYPLGQLIDGFRNENLEQQTFENESFDLVVTLDVMEHVFDPQKAYEEIFRTLRPGGVYLHTFPISKFLTQGAKRRAEIGPDGQINLLVEPPEYHLNPVDERGSLVTFDYGYDIGRAISEWAPFDVRILRFWDQTHGVIGEHTEVVVCRKPA
ncbi:MAG: class I SAM-dependent methyltransferase [Nitrospiraceae bacterium]|nr:class I SAM-dependent methyltransferase [Nitrospiraceae bacterium]